jgi:hypothetical protein
LSSAKKYLLYKPKEIKMKNKVFLLTVLLSVITAVGTWAQNLPANIWTSPQSSTTEGRYRSNADDFIRPDSFLGVKFEKWFGLVSFLQDDTNAAIATVGFAAKAGGVYIGAFYNGNLWTGTPVNNYTETELSTAPAGGTTGTVYNVYGTAPSAVGTSVNNVALLIGVADMGFRLTYRTNYQLFDEDNIVIGTQTSSQLYKNYHAEYGYMAPQIAWAVAKDLTGNGIRPYVTVDLIFNRDYQKSETADGNSGENINRSLNYFSPVFSAGLGGYTLYNQNGFKFSGDLDYVLTMNLYDNEYSYLDGTTYKTLNIKGTWSPGTFALIERSYMSNLITPSVSGSWSKDNLALKFKLNLPVTLISEEQNGMTRDGDHLVYNNASDSTFTFVFRPDVRLALQYKIVPNRLTLSTGARIQTTSINTKTTTRKSYNMGNKISTQRVHQDSVNGINENFASRFSIGATLNFTDNAWVEATTGVSNAFGNSGTIDAFAPGGLFSFGSILVSLKF